MNDIDPRLSLITDIRVPICRSLDRSYAGADHTDFRYYLIDGFIVSNNLTANTLETVQLDFAASDHNPVRLSVTLAP